MNSRITQLKLLLRIKQEELAKAYLEWAGTKEQFLQSKSKHEQLVRYRHDYLQQLEVLGSQGSSVGHLRNRILFIHQLDSAVTQLNGHLAQLAKQRALAEKKYHRLKVAEQAIEALIQRILKEDSLQLQRKEQKESDEYAQKQWYSKNITDQLNTFGE